MDTEIDRHIDPRSFAAALAVERGSVCIAPGVLAIPLKRGKGPQGLVQEFALVSAEDGRLRSYNWSKDQWGYVRRREAGTGRGIRMHREVMGLPNTGRRGITGDVVDHINRDRLDNRRENLRICKQAENAQNHSGNRNGTSQYRGVSWSKSKQKWVVTMKLNGKQRSFGYFDDEEDANQRAIGVRRAHMPFSVD